MFIGKAILLIWPKNQNRINSKSIKKLKQIKIFISKTLVELKKKKIYKPASECPLPSTHIVLLLLPPPS